MERERVALGEEHWQFGWCFTGTNERKQRSRGDGGDEDDSWGSSRFLDGEKGQVEERRKRRGHVTPVALPAVASRRSWRKRKRVFGVERGKMKMIQGFESTLYLDRLIKRRVVRTEFGVMGRIRVKCTIRIQIKMKLSLEFKIEPQIDSVRLKSKGIGQN